LSTYAHSKGFGNRHGHIGMDINTNKYSIGRILISFGRKTTVFVIPKKNISKIDLEWKSYQKNHRRPVLFLKNYFLMNINESGFSSDKMIFATLYIRGGMTGKKRLCSRSLFYTTYSSLEMKPS